MDYVLIISGLLLLFIGGEALVRGSVAVSERLGVSAILIGVVVVGFGTSTPELLVSAKASFACQPDIALGNVVGSNIANILFILGVSAVICPVICDAVVIRRDAYFLVVASILLFALTFFDTIISIHGLFMLALLLLYVFYAYKAEVKEKRYQLRQHQRQYMSAKHMSSVINLA